LLCVFAQIALLNISFRALNVFPAWNLIGKNKKIKLDRVHWSCRQNGKKAAHSAITAAKLEKFKLHLKQLPDD